MMTGWPKIFEAPSASERMVMSVGPPAGKAMTSLIGLAGNGVPCASDSEGIEAMAGAASAAADCKSWRRFMGRFIKVSGKRF